MDVRLVRRFWKHVDRSGECWLWTGYCFSNGYGCIAESGTGKRKKLLAHRVSLEIANGAIPDGLSVLHRCDVRNCVNPSHLFLGTAADNVHDCMQKGRQGDHRPHRVPKGSAHYRSQLNEQQVMEIRQAYAAGDISMEALASRYGVQRGVVQKIVHGISWQHLPVIARANRDPHTYNLAVGERHGRHKLTAEQVLAIYHATGTHQAIANGFGICRPTVSLIKSGKQWATVTRAHEGTP